MFIIWKMLRILNDFKKLFTHSSQRQFLFGFIQGKADPFGFKFVENYTLAIDIGHSKKTERNRKVLPKINFG